MLKPAINHPRAPVHDDIIEVRSLGKHYFLGASRRIQIHEAVERIFRKSVRLKAEAAKESFWALKDCSFKVRKGEVVGILGHNGAGKSVLLKMLSRVVQPTEGSAILRGRVASILELGAGFDPEMTGRENILFNGAILGVSQAQMSARMKTIVAFAELERFIDEPTKTYSSGMYARLAFSVASHVEADVLLIDEVLAVGDAAFSRRCIQRLETAAENGATILFVSHSVDTVQSLCTRCLVIDSGTLVFDGDPRTAAQIYREGRGGGLRSSRPPVQEVNGR